MTPQTFGPGSTIATPDTCMTPPLAIPAPFPNLAVNSTAVPSQYTIMINGQPVLTTAANNPTTSGDEAGTLGGVVSGIIKGPAMVVMGSMAYVVGGTPAARNLDPTMQNMSNGGGAHSVPSQTVVTVMR